MNGRVVDGDGTILINAPASLFQASQLLTPILPTTTPPPTHTHCLFPMSNERSKPHRRRGEHLAGRHGLRVHRNLRHEPQKRPCCCCCCYYCCCCCYCYCYCYCCYCCCCYCCYCYCYCSREWRRVAAGPEHDGGALWARGVGQRRVRVLLNCGVARLKSHTNAFFVTWW
jgi:hypothetical protein